MGWPCVRLKKQYESLGVGYEGQYDQAPNVLCLMNGLTFRKSVLEKELTAPLRAALQGGLAPDQWSPELKVEYQNFMFRVFQFAGLSIKFHEQLGDPTKPRDNPVMQISGKMTIRNLTQERWGVGDWLILEAPLPKEHMNVLIPSKGVSKESRPMIYKRFDANYMKPNAAFIRSRMQRKFPNVSVVNDKPPKNLDEKDILAKALMDLGRQLIFNSKVGMEPVGGDGKVTPAAFNTLYRQVFESKDFDADICNFLCTSLPMLTPAQARKVDRLEVVVGALAHQFLQTKDRGVAFNYSNASGGAKSDVFQP
jgi:hypothetical protein